jgi:hypothetical protein
MFHCVSDNILIQSCVLQSILMGLWSLERWKSPLCVAGYFSDSPPPPFGILLDVAECHAPLLCSDRLPAARRVYMCVCACVPRSITYLSFLPSCILYFPLSRSCLPELSVAIRAWLLSVGSYFCFGNFYYCSMFITRLLGNSSNFCYRLIHMILVGLFVTLFYRKTFIWCFSTYRWLLAICWDYL